MIIFSEYVHGVCSKGILFNFVEKRLIQEVAALILKCSSSISAKSGRVAEKRGKRHFT